MKNNKDNITELKECFIITPIGSPESEIYKKTEGLINSALKPVLLEHGYFPLPAHHIDSSGSINKQIIEKIVNCELVIANLTGINPNVMYELAIRHSFGKRIITVAEFNTVLPFDINDQRTIFYHDTMHGLESFKSDLHKSISKVLIENDNSQNVSNPIYDAINQVAEIKNLPSGERDAMEIILSKLERLERHNISNRQQNLVEFRIKSSIDISKIINEISDVFSTHGLDYFQKSTALEENTIFIMLNNLGESFTKSLYKQLTNINGVISVVTRFYD